MKLMFGRELLLAIALSFGKMYLRKSVRKLVTDNVFIIVFSSSQFEGHTHLFARKFLNKLHFSFGCTLLPGKLIKTVSFRLTVMLAYGSDFLHICFSVDLATALIPRRSFFLLCRLAMSL